VPSDNPPAKNDWELVVESKLPTVNCEVVAMMLVPSEEAVRMALLAKAKLAVRVPEVVTGLPVMLKALGKDNETEVTVPEFCERQLPEMA